MYIQVFSVGFRGEHLHIKHSSAATFTPSTASEQTDCPPAHHLSVFSFLNHQRAAALFQLISPPLVLQFTLLLMCKHGFIGEGVNKGSFII